VLTTVVQVDPALTDPPQSPAIASCLVLDVIVKQKNTGG
jgi:hypothetical protein